MTPDLHARFLWFVRQKQLIRQGDRVLVAVSGGVDSMVLLHLLHTSAAELGITVMAAHFDHAMRPTSADDARFVARICDDWSVPLVMQRAEHTPRSEADAREMRYRFLSAAMLRHGATRIATAHHADDQVETVLFRLLRGAGLRGLSGIPIRRGAIIRPLLRFPKKAMADYAAQHHIEFREDESNFSERFTRNRIRHEVIPALLAARPQSAADLLRLARHAARTERAWRVRLRAARKRVVARAESHVSELARGILLEYDAETQARLLRAELGRLGFVPDRAATDRMVEFVARAESGRSHSAGGGVRVERAFDVIRISRADEPQESKTVEVAGCANGADMAELGGRSWRVSWMTSAANAIEGERFDCDALRFPLVIRSWRPGDRIRMPYGTKKLKKLFSEARIPLHERAAVPVLVDADGRICWVVGVARSVDAPAAQAASAITIMVKHAEIS